MRLPAAFLVLAGDADLCIDHDAIKCNTLFYRERREGINCRAVSLRYILGSRNSLTGRRQGITLGAVLTFYLGKEDKLPCTITLFKRSLTLNRVGSMRGQKNHNINVLTKVFVVFVSYP